MLLLLLLSCLNNLTVSFCSHLIPCSFGCSSSAAFFGFAVVVLLVCNFIAHALTVPPCVFLAIILSFSQCDIWEKFFDTHKTTATTMRIISLDALRAHILMHFSHYAKRGRRAYNNNGTCCVPLFIWSFSLSRLSPGSANNQPVALLSLLQCKTPTTNERTKKCAAFILLIHGDWPFVCHAFQCAVCIGSQIASALN